VVLAPKRFSATLLLLLLLLLLHSATLTATDVDGCVGNSEACVDVENTKETCVDEPAPRTGYKCACKSG
jgi:hypothetical protein